MGGRCMTRARRNPMNIRLHQLIEHLVASEVCDAGVWRARCPAHRGRGEAYPLFAYSA